MRALGIAVEPSAGRPQLHVAVVETAADEPVLVEAFSLNTTETEPGSQAVNLARLLEGRLPGIDFDVAAIKTAGAAPVPRRNRAQFQRAHAEGAVLFVVTEASGLNVVAKDAQGLASIAGRSKVELQAAAEALVRKQRDAAYAALSVLT